MVSICVVTYNHAGYIRDCLMSVLAQAEDVSLEILVGDDQSVDETGTILAELEAKYPDLIRYFRHADRIGGAENYQFLIKEARGKYIAHLDGDDFWLPGKLRRQIGLLETRPDIVATYGNAIVVSDSGVLRGAFNRLVPADFDIGFLLRKGNFLFHGSLVYRESAKSAILCLAPPFLDYQVHLQLAGLGKLGYVNSVLAAYRVGSTTSATTHQSGYVAELYWQALESAVPANAARRDVAAGMAQFLMISTWNRIATGRWRGLGRLLHMVMNRQPVSNAEFLAYVLVAVIDHAAFKVCNAVSRFVLRRDLKVYFSR